jgi:hypothetical protein
MYIHKTVECVHLSKNNLSINSINFDNFFDNFDIFDKFDKYDIFPKSNYYNDILVKFSKIFIFLVHLKNSFLKVLFLTVLVSLMKYFRQFVVKSEVKHTIFILASFHFISILVKKYRIRYRIYRIYRQQFIDKFDKFFDQDTL